jgi:putative oxidoreductase
MDVLLLIGRVLFSMIFLASAAGHFKNTEGMAGYAASKGLKNAKPLVQLTGLMLAIGALAVLLGVYAQYGVLLLIAFLIPTTFIMHAFWKETDPMAKMNEQVAFFKNLGLIGGGLFLYVLLEVHSELGLFILN